MSRTYTLLGLIITSLSIGSCAIAMEPSAQHVSSAISQLKPGNYTVTVSEQSSSWIKSVFTVENIKNISIVGAVAATGYGIYRWWKTDRVKNWINKARDKTLNAVNDLKTMVTRDVADRVKEIDAKLTNLDKRQNEISEELKAEIAKNTERLDELLQRLDAMEKTGQDSADNIKLILKEIAQINKNLAKMMRQ